MPEIDRVGHYQGIISEYGFHKGKDSQSISLAFTAKLSAAFNAEGEWERIGNYEYTVDGMVCIIKRDGAINDIGTDQLIKHTGWNGSFDDITNQTWIPKPCQFVIEREEFRKKNGETVYTFKASRLENHDKKPGARGNVSQDEARQLQMSYQSQFQAIARSLGAKVPEEPAWEPPPPPPPGSPFEGSFDPDPPF